MNKKKIPLWLAILYILMSIGLICGPAYFGFKSYARWKHGRMVDPSFTIQTIVQSTDGPKTIPSEVLGKIMGLPFDKPQNLFVFDVRKAKKKLKAYPVIKRVQVRKVKPSTIYVDYELRKPFFLLGDYENIALDREGYPFPLLPTYQGESFVEVLLGLPSFGTNPFGTNQFGTNPFGTNPVRTGPMGTGPVGTGPVGTGPLGNSLAETGKNCSFEEGDKRKRVKWNVAMQDPYTRLAFALLDELFEYQNRNVFKVKKVDLTMAYAPSLGKREILVFIEEEISLGDEVKYIFPKKLRISTKEYSKQLQDFQVLHEKMMNDYKKQLMGQPKEKGEVRFAMTTVDLRISSIAFIDN